MLENKILEAKAEEAVKKIDHLQTELIEIIALCIRPGDHDSVADLRLIQQRFEQWKAKASSLLFETLQSNRVREFEKRMKEANSVIPVTEVDILDEVFAYQDLLYSLSGMIRRRPENMLAY